MQLRQQLTGIGELRNHRRVGVGRGFDPAKTNSSELLDQLALGRRWQEVGFVLQPVTGKALAQNHVFHRRHSRLRDKMVDSVNKIY
ncbi:hypothetical protein D3C76_1643330 [compost metagenome]